MSNRNLIIFYFISDKCNMKLQTFKHASHKENCIKMVENSLYDSDFSDVCIINETDRFYSHRIVLANSSEFFDNVFRSQENKDKSPLIIMDEDTELVRCLLEFVYLGETTLCYTRINDLIELGVKYRITGLWNPSSEQIPPTSPKHENVHDEPTEVNTPNNLDPNMNQTHTTEYDYQTAPGQGKTQRNTHSPNQANEAEQFATCPQDQQDFTPYQAAVSRKSPPTLVYGVPKRIKMEQTTMDFDEGHTTEPAQQNRAMVSHPSTLLHCFITIS